MLYHWLNKQNNKNLIVFFAGWSFDYNPFKFLACDNFDVIIFYDYNNLESDFDFNQFDIYISKYLITWSMGVYCAYLIKDKFNNFDKKIAINGTPFPVDDKLGIPVKPFLLTLKHAEKGLEGKFYKNLFNSENEYKNYTNSQVMRTIENRVDELQSLYKRILSTERTYEKFYDLAIVSTCDKIVPPNNQTNCWREYDVDIQYVENGHFPYYNYTYWNELLCL